jgi:putative salt-induced outer membrane protein YdiY
MHRRRVGALLCGIVACGGALAADEPELGWSDKAELSYVMTAGNSEGSTLGLKNELKRTWADALFTLRASAVRAESTTFFRTAVGTPDSFVLIEDEESNLTAENYLLAGRYDQEITERFFWYGGAGWDRNRFAGIQNRYVAEGGVGNVWVDTDTVKFKTSYALTYTDQEDVVEVPDSDGGFLGLRLGWDYLHQFGANTTYTNVLVVDDNLDETSDWRADMTNSVAVAMNKRLALKATLQWLYDNQPSFTAVPLVDGLGVPTGASALVELDELDTVFTTSLVVNF